MERFADWISQKMYLKKYILVDDIDNISFALEVVLSHVISFGFILVVGMMMKASSEVLLFFISFALFRTLNDRYHAATFLSCFILTVGSFLLSLGISRLIIPDMRFQFIMFGAGLNVLLAFEPLIRKRTTIKKVFCIVMIGVSLCLPILSMWVNQALVIFVTSVLIILTSSVVFPEEVVDL